MPTYIVESPEDSSWRNVAIPLIDPVLGLLRTARWVRGNPQDPRAARENLKIEDIGPRAPRVVWLRRVYSPSEVWQGNLWLDSGKTWLLSRCLGVHCSAEECSTAVTVSLVNEMPSGWQ